MKNFPLTNEKGNVTPSVREDLKASGTHLFVRTEDYDFIEEKGNLAVQIGTDERTQEPIFYVLEPKIRKGTPFTKKSTSNKKVAETPSYDIEL